jgi:hypothetical protein
MSNTATALSTPPAENEYSEYYNSYISKFNPTDFLNEFEAQVAEVRSLFGGLSAEEETTLHAPYTWTLKQVLGHLIDCERIFSGRVLRIAVGDETPIPGIDQDIYVANLDYETVTMDELIDEFSMLRKSNVLLAKRLTPEAIARMGTASDNPISAKANLFILGGHVVYHAEIVKKRLGIV